MFRSALSACMLFIFLPVLYTEGYLDRRSERAQKAVRQAASAIIFCSEMCFIRSVWVHGYLSAAGVDVLKSAGREVFCHVMIKTLFPLPNLSLCSTVFIPSSPPHTHTPHPCVTSKSQDYSHVLTADTIPFSKPPHIYIHFDGTKGRQM